MSDHISLHMHRARRIRTTEAHLLNSGTWSRSIAIDTTDGGFFTLHLYGPTRASLLIEHPRQEPSDA